MNLRPRTPSEAQARSQPLERHRRLKSYRTIAAFLFDHPVPWPGEDPSITEYRQRLGLLPYDLTELEPPRDRL